MESALCYQCGRGVLRKLLVVKGRMKAKQNYTWSVLRVRDPDSGHRASDQSFGRNDAVTPTLNSEDGN
jgi:hypothetical protein